MASLLGYSAVPNTGFVGFNRALDEGAWGLISTKGWDGKKKDGDGSLLDVAHGVALKLELRGAIGALIEALGAGNLGELDEDWDSTQRRLSFRVAEGRNAKDRSVRAAADRLAGCLLVNGGTLQTNLDFDAEVDFGWTQVDLVKNDPRVAADVKKVKLQDVMDDVQSSTNALAEALGRFKGKKRKSRSAKLKEAAQGCVTAFNSVHQSLLLLLSMTPKGAGHDRISALLEPMDDLLARGDSAAPVPAGEEAATPEEAVVKSAAPAPSPPPNPA